MIIIELLLAANVAITLYAAYYIKDETKSADGRAEGAGCETCKACGRA
jgi:hypothetical protein